MIEMNPTQCSQAVHHCIKEGAEDAGARELECTPELAFRFPPRLADGRHGQENSPVPQIRPADHLLDPIQQDRARRLEQYLLVVGVEPPYGEAASGRQPAKGIGEPVRQAGELSKAST